MIDAFRAGVHRLPSHDVTGDRARLTVGPARRERRAAGRRPIGLLRETESDRQIAARMDTQDAEDERFATAFALIRVVIVTALLFLLLVGLAFIYD